MTEETPPPQDAQRAHWPRKPTRWALGRTIRPRLTSSPDGAYRFVGGCAYGPSMTHGAPGRGSGWGRSRNSETAMNEKHIPLSCLLASTVTGVGICLILAAGFGFTPYIIADLGLAGVALGCLLTVRRWLTQMQEREQRAFELGRESVRSIH